MASNTAEKMRAWVCQGPGPLTTTLKLDNDAPRPSNSLQDGQIIVRVSCAALNPADYKVLEMGVAARTITSFPKTPGMDLSGRVVEVATDVEDTKVGDVVFARVDPTKTAGTLAEYAILNRDAYATLPQLFDLEQAAGAPTASLTAYQTISPYVKSGDKIFLNGGSGGVGSFGIQIGKALGCHVTVSCSTEKADFCKSLGADEIIDYKTSDITAELAKKGQVFALAVDNVSNAPANLYTQSHTFLVPTGTFVAVGGAVSVGSALNLAKNALWPSFLGGGKRKFVPYMTKNSREDLEQIAKWLVDGSVKTVIDSTFKFEETLEAYEHLKKGSSAGKVVVRLAEMGAFNDVPLETPV